MREWKMRYGRNCKGGKCRSRKCRSKPYGTPSRDCIEKALSYFVRFVPLNQESMLVIALKIIAVFVFAD